MRHPWQDNTQQHKIRNYEVTEGSTEKCAKEKRGKPFGDRYSFISEKFFSFLCSSRADAGWMLMMMTLLCDANDRFVLGAEEGGGEKNLKQLIHHTCTMYTVYDELSQLALEVS